MKMSTTSFQWTPQPRQALSYHHLDQLSLSQILRNPQSLRQYFETQAPPRRIQLCLMTSHTSLDLMTILHKLHRHSLMVLLRGRKAQMITTVSFPSLQDLQIHSSARFVLIVLHSKFSRCSDVTRRLTPSRTNAESSKAANFAALNDGTEYATKSIHTESPSMLHISSFALTKTANRTPSIQKEVLESEKTMQRDTSERCTWVQPCCRYENQLIKYMLQEEVEGAANSFSQC